jgi:hypothetical protein
MRTVEENNLTQAISALRRALGHGPDGAVIHRDVARSADNRFVAHVAHAPGLRLAVEAAGPSALEPAAGAVPLSSRFYIVRPEDEQLHDALARRDSVVLLKGARQIGKTSMLARGLQNARESGARVTLTDFQDLGATDLASPKALF